jgi:N-acetylmuramoyl-L-alanine amidase
MIKWVGCPDANFHRGRPFGLQAEAIVIHIMDGSFAAGESVFRDPTTQKSAHYGISKMGELHQYVDENDTAFHAGIVVNPSWPLLKPRVNPNFYTIGIEHEGRPDDVWSEAQLSASAALIGQIAERWKIALDDLHVIRHHQIRASKTCPGNWLQIPAVLKRVPVSAPSAAAPPKAAPSDNGGMPAPASTKSTDPVSPMAYATVVRTTRRVNLRRGKPSTTAQVLRVIPPHADVVVCEFEIGDPLDGNANWYSDVQGNYFWAGATDTPDPTVLTAAQSVGASAAQ